AAFIAVINSLLSSAAPRPYLGWVFVGLCVALPVTRFLSNFLLVRLTNRALKQLRIDLCGRILAAPLRQLEQIGPPRLLATITEDVGSIVSGIANIPQLVMNLTLVAGCLAYLGYLSPRLLLLVVAAVVVGVATYQVPVLYAQRHFRREREAWDDMFEHLRGVTQGTKELKIHGRRRREFLSGLLEPTAEALRRHNVAGNTTYDAANSWGQVLFFVIIGIVLFTRGWAGGKLAVLAGYTLTILYMMTPLQLLLYMLPNLGRASVAVEKIERLGLSLLQSSTEAPAPAAAAAPANWNRLELIGVEHRYQGERDAETFALGPLDLAFRSGELVFLVGGNGSGKTTLAKLLLGLYAPEKGELRLDGMPITDQNRDLYRQMFSVVFTDFHLFKRLLGLDGADLGQRAAEYLEQLQLDRKVRIEERNISTTDLSQGQRKRLALLTAYLEDRPIYLFDEWAADQDPHFKEIFYTHLLMNLKARGKTLFVISHDDRYYHLADRVIRLDYGKLQYDLPPSELLEPALRQG
ncbi:MAG TPA: cyclic peptide export ABC transporter, partial [Thermoanaerobaculia bacterium]|nr:cyclic peptide export ABC transporter [Thermoanaerobaculia bacterium]